MFRHFAVWKARAREEHEQRVGQAWLTARLVAKGFHEPNKVPTLKQLLEQQAGRQTVAQQRATVTAIADAYKLTLRRGKKTSKKKR